MAGRTRMRVVAILGGLVLCAGARMASAQGSEGGGYSRYDIYGAPADVSVDDLVNNSSFYENRAVHTKGRLEILPVSGARVYVLRGNFMSQGVMVIPVNDVEPEFE